MKKFWIVPFAALAFGSACGDSSTTRSTEPQFAPGGVLKDDISNNLDETIDAIAETMPLNVGVQGTTTLYVEKTGDDGKNGCNFQSSETLIVSVSTSDASVATVSPSSLTFGNCNDKKTLTVTPVAAGTATISLSQTSNNTGATFRLDRATFTVSVTAPPPSNNAPSLSVGGVTPSESYIKGLVPAAVCNVTDTEDGSSSFPATLSAISGPYAADDIGSQTASCSYTDKGGLSASASITYGIAYDDDSAPDIAYSLNPSSPDGLNGWYKHDVSLAWIINETASPASLVKTGCVDQSITSDQAATDYKCAASSAGGSADEISLTVKRDATAPTAAYTGVSPASPDGQNGWYLNDVTLTFTATDNLSGFGDPASLTTESTVITTGEGAEISSPSPMFTDNAGNVAASVNSDAFKIDKTDPTALATLSVAANPNGWHNVDVTVKFTGSDHESGFAGCDPDTPIATEGKNQTASGKCRDNAGREKEATASVNLDKTAPTVTYTSASPLPIWDGWYDQDVTATFTATDNLSGFGVAEAISTTGQTTSVGEGVAVAVSSPAFVDNASNAVAAGMASHSFKVDKTAPTDVVFVGSLANGASYYYGEVPASPTCTAKDALSGLSSCAVTGYDNSVGPHTVTATATDKVGHSAIKTLSYTVDPWSLKGFYQPVDMSGVYNTVKGGSTVPLKFEIFAGSTELVATSSIKSFTSAVVVCNGAALTDDIEVTTTGGTTLRYDASGGQFIQNWQTPVKPGTCHRVTMTTQDGSTLIAYFKLK